MKLSRDSVLALQRHFLGALRAPARAWLEPLPSPPLVFLGSAIRAGALDLGSVPSPGEERSQVRICNRSAERIEVRIAELPAWLTARWPGVEGETVSMTGGDAASLEVLVIHDEERQFHGVLRFAAGGCIEELPVRMTARRSHPLARFDFNGSAIPHPFDFGSAEGSYRLSVANATSVPLVVTFADLPDALTFEVDGRHRTGPITGPFFERTAPFAVTLRPHLFGLPGGVLRVRTNDPRAEMRDIALAFTGFPAASKRRTGSVPHAAPSHSRPLAMIALAFVLFLTLLFVIARGL